MKHISYLILVLATAFSPSCRETYQPQTGDLLFMDLDCGSFCDAIKKVTYGIDSTRPSHVGTVYVESNNTYVLEADTRGVVKTPLDSFLNRSLDANGKPKVFAGRLKKDYQPSIPKAMDDIKRLLGKPYDFAFDINNDCYYCSELLYKAFLDRDGKPLFKLDPMTFNDPGTHVVFPVWEDYFKELGIPVPEGSPGLNPGSISRSDKIEIVHWFYK